MAEIEKLIERLRAFVAGTEGNETMMRSVAAPMLTQAAAILASLFGPSDGDIGRVAGAIDADLQRQAAVQNFGANYRPADECGVASADMDIVIREVAIAAIAALAAFGKVKP